MKTRWDVHLDPEVLKPDGGFRDFEGFADAAPLVDMIKVCSKDFEMFTTISDVTKDIVLNIAYELLDEGDELLDKYTIGTLLYTVQQVFEARFWAKSGVDWNG